MHKQKKHLHIFLSHLIDGYVFHLVVNGKYKENIFPDHVRDLSILVIIF